MEGDQKACRNTSSRTVQDNGFENIHDQSYYTRSSNSFSMLSLFSYHFVCKAASVSIQLCLLDTSHKRNPTTSIRTPSNETTCYPIQKAQFHFQFFRLQSTHELVWALLIPAIWFGRQAPSTFKVNRPMRGHK